MKLLFLLFSIGLPLQESRLDRIPQATSPYSECDSREVAKGIHQSARVARSTIFHYGKKEILLKDVAAGTVPESDWNDFIMGEKTRFKLKRFRRGFYGTEFAEDADRFGDATYNWLIEIELKRECLDSYRTTSLVYLPESERFQSWYAKKSLPQKFEAWKKFCFDTQNYPRSKYFIDYKNKSETADFSETSCESVVAQFYEDEKFAFVHDYAGDLVRSWALRDRECIEKIEGSDSYWAKAFAEREEFWVNTCNRERNHRNAVRVWFAAIETAGIQSANLEKFAKIMKTVPPPLDVVEWESQESDRFAAQDFAEALGKAHHRCKGNQKTFQLFLGEMARSVDELNSADVKERLESLCR